MSDSTDAEPLSDKSKPGPSAKVPEGKSPDSKPHDGRSHDWAGSRRLLRLLRDLMKERGSSQMKLDKIVKLIAQDIVAEVCSIYVLRSGDVLELFATMGLKPEAVHQTRLHVEEGIVGQVAALALPLALSDAQKHPNFAYRPETGEENYQSLLGVPIQRAGRVIGVLAVQNVTPRNYTDEEVEALETVAMLLAELFAGGEIALLDETAAGDDGQGKPMRLDGLALNDGLAIGQAVPHTRGIVISQVIADDPEEERERLVTAVAEMRGAIDDLLARADIAELGEHREILEVYRMFAEDKGWIGRIDEAILSGLTAEAAVEKIQVDTRTRMAKVKDPYLKERLSDLEDLGNRLLHHLLELDGTGPQDLPDDMVLIARNLGPAELLDYDATRLRAVVLEEGSPTAHVVIMARALNIPIIGRCRDIVTSARPGDRIVVDADNEQVLLRPNEEVQATFASTIAERDRRKEIFAATRDLPPVTLDGLRIALNINAGLLIDIPHLHDSGADGIGLYRTEIAFMVRDTFPGVTAQTELYSRVVEQADGKPVVFRTLDVGGDKVLPYWQGEVDENPAMGWRAIRIGLDRPAVLRQQIRALLRASQGGELRIMFPMISDVAEFETARALLDREIEREGVKGRTLPSMVKAGVMLEVPSLYWQLPALLDKVDFVSVGSNDLFQFHFAADRGNPRLVRRYDVLAPGFLKLLHGIASQASAKQVALSLCGDMAAHPLEAMALLGCGFESLSMPAPSVAPVKTMIRSLNLAPLKTLLPSWLELPDHSLRDRLRSYAKEQGVEL
ncbi:phosphoenolpyruvate--protein phosphotransferase [Pelagibius sp. Alg239-R121]|uniref:phosphoenolpyruvate--protein phosphotransferase n=1 Tax=Pelagibius sp. Alg239-R121 TaxID=2993448 RepID=UPI002AC34EFD|nr:phosphoenolpyruvate--protein phosphotransferase [Pelagibius sp. Alg239-R121]